MTKNYLFLVFLVLRCVGIYSQESMKNMSSIEPLLELAKRGNYAGDKRLRHRWGKDVPIYTQRTSFLYYVRDQIGEPLMWVSLVMGKFMSRRLNDILLDKKNSFMFWEKTLLLFLFFIISFKLVLNIIIN